MRSASIVGLMFALLAIIVANILIVETISRSNQQQLSARDDQSRVEAYKWRSTKKNWKQKRFRWKQQTTDKIERRINPLLLPLRLLLALLRLLLLPIRLLLAPLIVLLRALLQILRLLLRLLNPLFYLYLFFLLFVAGPFNIARLILMILRIIFLRKRRKRKEDREITQVITISEPAEHYSFEVINKPKLKHKVMKRSLNYDHFKQPNPTQAQSQQHHHKHLLRLILEARLSNCTQSRPVNEQQLMIINHLPDTFQTWTANLLTSS